MTLKNLLGMLHIIKWLTCIIIFLLSLTYNSRLYVLFVFPAMFEIISISILLFPGKEI